MADGLSGGGGSGHEESGGPGHLSMLLQELARAPGDDLHRAWQQRLQPGDAVGRFEILREIGRGGFGVVYEALDRQLGRSVAFKTLRPARTGHELSADWILKEAEAVARLDHPAIVTLHDVGRCESGPYLVEELLRGETLEQRLHIGPLPPHEAVAIGLELARGLAHAHGRGVLHRDLKPGNVFLTEDGRVKLLDFGLAHLLGTRGLPGSGTPAYMAPEQLRGDEIDARTDVYAAAVTLREMLTGQRSPAAHASVPRALARPLERALSANREDRPRDGTAWLEELVAVQRAMERPTKVRRVAGLVLAGLVLGAVVAGIVVERRSSGGGGRLAADADGRISVAVADFANQTGDADLEGLSGLLITSLEQSKKLRVLTRSRMWDHLRAMGKEQVEHIDEPLAREVGKRAGARALLLASVRRLDEVYAVEMRAFDPHRDEYVFTVREQSTGKKGILGLIDRLSERTRAELGEAPAEVVTSGVKVAEATTASFGAYQHYFRGEQLMDAVRYDAALEEYRKAIADDPTFALAHYQIAYLGEFTDLDMATRKAEIELAIRNVDRVPEKERLLIRAWKAHMDGHNDQAHALYAEVVQRFPQDKEALYMAGDRYFHEERVSEALPLFERALVLDPGWEPALMHLTDSLFFLERKDDLLARSRAWVERTPNGSAYRALSLAHLLGRRWDDAVEAARRALAADDSLYSRLRLAEALLCAERYQEVESMLRPRTDPSVTALERARAAHGLVAALAFQGRWREALQVAETRLEQEGPTSSSRHELELVLHLGRGAREQARVAIGGLVEAAAKAGRPWKDHAAALALAGDLEGAAEQAKKLEPGIERSQFEAASAWRGGRRDEAFAILRELAARPDRPARALTLWMLAEVAVETRRDREALAALDRLVGGRAVAGGGLLRIWIYPRGLYLAALAHERLGERAKALQEIDHLLGLWKRADPDLPLLAEAKALQRRLGSASRSAD